MHRPGLGVHVHPLPRLREHGAQDRLDLLELLRPSDQRRRELDHRIAAVVGATDQASAVELTRQEAAQERLRLLVAERLLGLLVLDQLDRLEVARASDVAYDRQVAQRLERVAEAAL